MAEQEWKCVKLPMWIYDLVCEAQVLTVRDDKFRTCRGLPSKRQIFSQAIEEYLKKHFNIRHTSNINKIPDDTKDE